MFPSVNQTFGPPLAEAMSAGIPIVAADTAVNREICREIRAEAALYVTPFSHRDVAGQIRLLAADATLRARMIDAGRRRVAAEFRWQSHVERLIAIFETAIADGARSSPIAVFSWSAIRRSSGA